MTIPNFQVGARVKLRPRDINTRYDDVVDAVFSGETRNGKLVFSWRRGDELCYMEEAPSLFIIYKRRPGDYEVEFNPIAPKYSMPFVLPRTEHERRLCAVSSSHSRELETKYERFEKMLAAAGIEPTQL